MPRLSEAQRDRSTYLGATDIAVLAGVSPYATPFELYLEKIGELDRQAATPADIAKRQERGHRLEDVALSWYADETGVRLDRVRRDVVHPQYPFIVVHPDARSRPWRGERRLYEAKTSARSWEKDDDGSLIAPQRVEVQVQAQMAAARADVATVIVLGFDGPPAGVEIPRDDELIRELERIAASFWHRNVETRTPPPLDGSSGASHYLDRRFGLTLDEARADPSQADALARLLKIRRELMPALEAEDARLVNALKFSMAAASKLYAPGVGKILWTPPATTRDRSWKDIAVELRERWLAETPEGDQRDVLEAELDDIVASHTTVREGRTFRPSPAKEGPVS